jgi:hypothetical protein
MESTDLKSFRAACSSRRWIPSLSYISRIMLWRFLNCAQTPSLVLHRETHSKTLRQQEIGEAEMMSKIRLRERIVWREIRAGKAALNWLR